MAYNRIPESESRTIDTTQIFDLTKMPINRNMGKGKPAVVLTQPQLIIAKAKAAASFNNKPLRPVSKLAISKGPAEEYYIEWWQLGTAETAIEAGLVHTRDIKNLAKLMIGNHRRSILYIKRERDQKVLWDRRPTRLTEVDDGTC